MVFPGVLAGGSLADVAVVLVATGVIWIGSGWLEGSADTLSAYYELPAVVQGSIVVAVGSSFPELASVVFTALAGTFDMGVGAVVGSAIFNILVIPALAGIFSHGTMETNRAIVYKEAQFYMIAVSGLIITFALAVIYNPVPNGSGLGGEITRPLAMLPIGLYGLYLFIQWQDVSDYEATEAKPSIDLAREWAKLAGGLLLILVAVHQLVGSVESLGATFGIPEFLAGVTIIAGATSLPDMLVSIRSARGGNEETSLGNVLGSNTFDLLVAIPIGVLIVGTVAVDFAVAIPMFGVLTLATVVLFAVMRTDLSLTTREAYLLLVSYLVFVGWVIAETIGVTSLIRGV
ncbi:sodium:calcium antiporter [Natronosalvus caseinilyticus]|uniref:sodium:calcium antiporter n=1 Tax=Natronosalvus caseinilyticus TaxID=2953747 RepID=UPI0028AA9BF1|nr:sodium:calcium antiporter [Natronosalvus caseinilyticus]